MANAGQATKSRSLSVELSQIVPAKSRIDLELQRPRGVPSMRRIYTICSAALFWRVMHENAFQGEKSSEK
uniref:Uncharacterized protein n=1 Tax=Globodera rostochiensis TaxID=31243 RepID=A0A914I671_GLORO